MLSHAFQTELNGIESGSILGKKGKLISSNLFCFFVENNCIFVNTTWKKIDRSIIVFKFIENKKRAQG